MGTKNYSDAPNMLVYFCLINGLEKAVSYKKGRYYPLIWLVP